MVWEPWLNQSQGWKKGIWKCSRGGAHLTGYTLNTPCFMIPWPLIDERDNILTFQLKVWLLSKNWIKSVWILFINIVVVVLVAQGIMDRSQMVILVTFLIAGRLSDKPGIVRFVRSTMIFISSFQSQREWWQQLDHRCCTGAMKRVYELPPIPNHCFREALKTWYFFLGIFPK